MADGEVQLRTLPGSVAVHDGEAYVAACEAGFGLIQLPRYRAEEHLASGALVEVLKDHAPTPTPVNLLWPRDRQLSARTRVFIDWAASRFEGMG